MKPKEQSVLLKIKSAEILFSVYPKDILYIEADGNFCKIKLVDGEIIKVAQRLCHYNTLFPQTIFCRIHKSYLLNLNHVKHYDKIDKCAVLVSNEKIPVSKRKTKDFLSQFFNKN
ncbi:MAG: hypothetical protein A2275_03260 [Bacteroidetes bacterium RIFOXYA12_FULL_35_11]|nr:MAG: hypothetical protein A2X01_08770 [Bacteroidetes bacterium GWF2_35_48]OFY72556.1 MAG: hypothetical protein A2275_03260 [Bacteroidetes bacterium RIFOXYA12_FULL_35_11]OFY93342.1 MAG: hypothetical protein A2491_07770 [Bacteroidetes bacterium RIFOXYC12_FULL_35_7]OFY97266.1 MAG: hypothetical protein A2309_10940 [Bacteroidetes bacterium RIFOXYB2_FULL_35_7]HBX52501.1 hypothetical protein [Bacteroidales bacterium]